MGKKGNLVIAIYSHPEYYPPTLNALEYLSAVYDKIYIVHRNITGFNWDYPHNVKLLHAGGLLHVRQAEQVGFKGKLQHFLGFTRLLRRTIRESNADTLLVYDFMPLLSYRMLAPFIRKPAVLWYHNHDVAEKIYIRKYSLSWWAWKSEQWIFPRLQVFSLPSVERQAYFPMGKLKGKFFFLPNFPSRKIYDRVPGTHDNPAMIMKLLYQGSIGPRHGLEEIIQLLPQTIQGKTLHLVLKGFIDDDYLVSLYKMAEENNVRSQVSYLGPSDYVEVIKNAKTCHIGIGIHKKDDIMNKTLGTASNKIYEYAAAGMPVLLYDNAHFRDSLQGRQWCFFTDTSNASLRQCLETIIGDYDRYSALAQNDFNNGLCFEHFFEPLVQYLNGRPA